MVNGCKADQRRTRRNKKVVVPKSTKKPDAANIMIMCLTCRQTFSVTTRSPALVDHAEKHSKTIEDCFPNYEDPSDTKLSKV